MTYTPTHRTELLDAKMRQCSPQVVIANFGKAPPGESGLGAMMLAMAKREGHRRKMPRSWDDAVQGRNGQEAADVTAAMFKVMNDWVVPVDIAAKVSAILGREVKVQLINNRLHSNKSGRFVSKPKTKRTKFWKLKVAK